MHSTILPSSTGWNSKEPIFTHSRAPLMLAPTWGTSGSRSRATPKASSR